MYYKYACLQMQRPLLSARVFGYSTGYRASTSIAAERGRAVFVRSKYCPRSHRPELRDDQR